MAEPWIRVHANIAEKRVVLRASGQLGVSINEAIGLLVRFWGAMSRNGNDGHVDILDDREIETWAGWRGRKGRFAEFIRGAHVDEDGRVNEWDEYAGKLEDRRAKDRERQQRRREERRMSRGQPADDPRDVTTESVPARANDTKRDDTKRETASSSGGVWRPILEAQLAERLPSESAKSALGAVVQAAASDVGKFGVVQAIAMMLDGDRGKSHHASPEQMCNALVAYTANGMSDGKWSTRHFEGFVLGAMRSAPVLKLAERGNPQGRATMLLGEIRKLVQTSQPPGQEVRRYIPKSKVGELGADVLAAYEAIGTDRFLNDTTGYLLRDFAAALMEASRAAS